MSTNRNVHHVGPMVKGQLLLNVNILLGIVVPEGEVTDRMRAIEMREILGDLIEGRSKVAGHGLIPGHQAQRSLEPSSAIDQLHRRRALLDSRAVSLQFPGFEHGAAIAEFGTKQFRVHFNRLLLTCCPGRIAGRSGRTIHGGDRISTCSLRWISRTPRRLACLGRRAWVRSHLHRLRRRQQPHALEQIVVTDNHGQGDDEEDDDAFFHGIYVLNRS